MSAAGRTWMSERSFFLIVLIISFPVLLINLGKVPFIEDEGIRGLVALEMDHSHQYIAPTLYGQPYFKKPPLWNWVLLLSYRITGVANEFTTRLPTLFFLFLYVMTIYGVYRRYTDERFAVLIALFTLTSGRILFWDSMLGLIDLAFSWVIFVFFWWVYHFHRKEKYLSLYTGAYALISVAFMLKALPAIVFLSLTLLATHLYSRTWKKLFSLQHLAGILLFVLLIAGYLVAFSHYQPIEKLLTIFIDESTQRTVLQHGIWDSILQIFTFPFEMIYHFLPWSVLSVALFRKDLRKTMNRNPFLTHTALVFLANIWVYWSSPEVYPRYLLMFIPLYLGVCLYLYEMSAPVKLRKLIDILLLSLAIGVLLGSLLVFFNPDTLNIEGIWWRWLIAAIPMTIALYYMLKREARLLLPGFCIFLVAARLGFSLIVLPARSIHSAGAATREDSMRVATRIAGKDVYLYHHDTLRYEVGFYLTAARSKPLSTIDLPPDDAYLLTDLTNCSTLPDHFQVVDSIKVRREEKYVYLVKGSTVNR
jgi:4-amino-4-deoxy-L-arabinose transferase-like glycosyltransferase